MSEESAKRPGFSLRRGWGMVLAISLLLNVFVLFAAFGHVMRDGEPPRGRGEGVRGFVRHNEDVQPIAKAVISERRKLRRQTGRQIYQARLGVIEALSAEPFDIAKLREAQSRLIEIRAEMGAVRQEGVAQFVERLNADQRRRLAEHLRKRAEHVAKRWRRYHRELDEKERPNR